jgi:hypothetical protein
MQEDYKELYEKEQERADRLYDLYEQKCDEYKVVLEKLSQLRLFFAELDEN